MSQPKSIYWTNERRRLADLQPWPRNPRQIKTDQAKRLVESFDKFGQVETIAIGPDCEVYNGHQRLNVLLQQHGGDHEVDVRRSSRALTEKEREKLTIFLHKGAAGEWDFDTLANEFELSELLEWGFSEKELDLNLWAGDQPEDPGAQMDRAEELREKWQVETGQLWQLGKHRLICGDCTDKAVVERVMGGERADMVFFDPPYGINKDGIANDGDLGVYREAVVIANIFMENNTYLCAFGWIGFIADMISSVDSLRFIWVCVNHTPNTGAHGIPTGLGFNEWSPLLIFAKGNPKPVVQIRDYLKNTDQSEVSKSAHPTPKNVEFCEYFIKRLSNGLVYDPTCGSGTTMVAAQRLGRRCFGIEIDPKYCAVAIQRWVDLTGGEPILVIQAEKLANE